MRNWGCLLGIAIILSSRVIAQQPPIPIEEGLTIELKKDAQVSEVVRSLKSLRNRFDSMGSKHPSRKQFEEQIKRQEEALRKRIQELAPSVEPKEDPLLMDPSGDGPGGSEHQPELSPDPASRNEPRTAGSSSDGRGDGAMRAQDQRFGDSETQDVFDGNTIEQRAYPWLDTEGFQDSGCFPRTRLMWGIQPIFDRDKRITSGVIWAWSDNWREKTRTEFWRGSKPILAFHPSKHFDLDGLAFVICRDTESNHTSSVEVWAITGTHSKGADSGGHLLCKGILGDQNDLLSMFFDPLKNELTVGVYGRLELIEKCPSIDARSSPQVGVILQLNARKRGELQDSVVPLKEPIVVASESIVTTIAEPQHAVGSDMRPFWRKKGSEPSQTPQWWKHRGKRIVVHDYDSTGTPLANGTSLWKRISSLEAGDLLLVQPGVYASQARLDLQIEGTATAPIVIQGQGAGVVFTRPDPTENVINIVNASYVALGGIEITGGSTGVRIQTASNLMIYNSTIHDVGNVGISLNFRNTSSIYLVDNEIYQTKGNGEGIYAGSHDGTRTTHDSFFVGNYIHDLASGADSQGDGIEIKNRSYGNTVKWNYIVGTKYPGITVYGTGEADKAMNIIQENILLDSDDCGIQVTANALVQGNWISGKNTGIASKPFGKIEPTNVRILGNTILTDTFGIKASQWNRSDNWIANNLICSKTRNYFHSGFGKAIYLSNQLVCNLEEGSDLERKAKTASNRLLASNDLFGRKRTAQGRVGAIEYLPSSFAAETVESNLQVFSHAIYQPSESRIQLMNKKTDNQPRNRSCLTEDLQPINVSQALVQVAVAADLEGTGAGPLYQVMIVDRSLGNIYWAETDNLDSEVPLVFEKRTRRDKEIREIGLTTNFELLLIDRDGLSTVLVR